MNRKSEFRKSFCLLNLFLKLAWHLEIGSRLCCESSRQNQNLSHNNVLCPKRGKSHTISICFRKKVSGSRLYLLIPILLTFLTAFCSQMETADSHHPQPAFRRRRVGVYSCSSTIHIFLKKTRETFLSSSLPSCGHKKPPCAHPCLE